MTNPGSSDNQMLMQLLAQQLTRKPSSALPAVSLVTSLLALAVAGVTGAYVFIGDGQIRVADQGGAFTQSSGLPPVASAPAAIPAAPAAANAPQSALPAAAAAATASANTRIAQSTNGSIYAFDPNTSLAFIFDPEQAGPTPISIEELPGDISTQLLSGASTAGAATGQTGAGVVDTAALEAQTARAREAIAWNERDETRPPLNDALHEPEIVTQLVDALDQAQGILRPGPDGSTEPVIYAFFDPQCPYCHRAFAGLDGRFTTKWLPVSTLGPGGDRLHAYIMDDVSLTDVAEMEDGQPGQKAEFATDEARDDRLVEVMTDQVDPPDAALSEAHSFVLAENGELFRILSRGAEEMRAVPTFFVRHPDGTATWLRGFDTNTGEEIAGLLEGADD